MVKEYRPLIRLGFPVLVTQLGIIAVSFADTIMVGQYGTRELGAAAFVNNIFLIAIVSMLGFAGGMMPVVGAFYGRNKIAESGSAFRAGLLLNLGMALAMTLAMGLFFLAIPYLGQPDELIPLIQPYYLIILSSILPSAIFTCGQNASNGVTDTAMPMWIMIGGNLLNILGNYLLIFGNFGFPELGLNGAGVSTALSRYLMAFAILYGFASRKRYRDFKSGFFGQGFRRHYRKVWRTSYPIMIQNGMECSLWMVGAIVCGWYGTAQLASYQIANTIGQFGFMIYLSAGIAVSIRVANHTGARDIPGIRATVRAGLHIMLVMATAASILFIFWGDRLFHLFTSDSLVIQAGLPLILPLVLYQYFDALQLNFGNALRGTAYVKPLITVSAVSYLLVGISSLFLLGTLWIPGNVGIYYSFGITLFCVAVMLMWYYRKALRVVETS